MSKKIGITILIVIFLFVGWPRETKAAASFSAANGTGGSLSTTVNIGSASTNRLVAVFAGSETDSAISLTGATVDGKSCNWVATGYNTNSLGNRTELWYCDEDDLGASNGSVTVAITGTGVTAANWAVHAIVYTGVAQSGPNDSGVDSASVSPATTTSVTNIDVSAGGVVVMGAHNGSGAIAVSTYTSPLTERTAVDPASADGVSASGIEASAQTNKTYTATWASAPNRSSGVVASWDEASSDPTFTLAHYRFYVDNDSENVTDPWGNPDIAESTTLATLPATNDPVGSAIETRLRVAITIGANNLSASAAQFKLQYKAGTDGSCTSGSWTDVGAGGGGAIWRYATSGVTDGTDLTVGRISTTDVLEEYIKSNPTGLNPNSATVGQDIEYDFHIQHNGAAEATTYSFRVLESDNTVFSTYTNCPTLQTSPGTANLLRHGEHFVDQSEVGFFWAN